ncbi:hypothetical protein Hanom_Chr06g00481911 [Helianthus anomalus]
MGMGPHLVKRLGLHMKSTTQIKYLLWNHPQRPPYSFSKIRTSSSGVENRSPKLLSDRQQEYDRFYEELRAEQRAMEDAATERRDRDNPSSKLLSDSKQQEHKRFSEELLASPRAFEAAAKERHAMHMRALHARLDASIARLLSELDELPKHFEAMKRDFIKDFAGAVLLTGVVTFTCCYAMISSRTNTRKDP